VLSERTVESHVAALFDKLGVRSRTEVVAAMLGGDRGETAQSNLPLQLNRLIGRADEVAHIAELLSSQRLVTITGTGGVGKTRLALEVADELARAGSSGAWLIELAPLVDPALIAGRIAYALGLHLPANDEPLPSLVALLKQKPLLLLLDNCEHLIGEVAFVADALLRNCPSLRILATSREPLKIAGERHFRLPSLRFPHDEAARTLTLKEAATYDAISLFIERAQAADERFALTAENVQVIAEICRRVDGIPLALELAAARANALPIEVLANHLDQRFAILTGGSRVALPRQQTMQATIDWSYDLLSSIEQRFFERLSVFAGGCTLEAAARVCTDGEVRPEAALSLICSLVDKSLVTADANDSEARYALLESMRAYAREKLILRGAEKDVKRRHAVACLHIAERLESEFSAVTESAWLAKGLPDLPNWRVALSWALTEKGDVRIGQRLAAALMIFFGRVGLDEGRIWNRLALASTDDKTPLALVARLEHGDAMFAVTLEDHQVALPAAKRALSAYRKLGMARDATLMRHVIGKSLAKTGRVDEGRRILRTTLAEARALGDPRIVASTLSALGLVDSMRGDDLIAARASFAEEIQVWRSVRCEGEAANAETNLATVEFQAGNTAEALALARKALTVQRAVGTANQLVSCLLGTSAYLLALARFDEARTDALDAFALARVHGLAVLSNLALQRLVAIIVMRSVGPSKSKRAMFECGARILGLVDERLNAMKYEREILDQNEYASILGLLRDELGNADLESLLTEGCRQSDEEAGALVHRLAHEQSSPGYG
jgi:predicted ATPase